MPQYVTHAIFAEQVKSHGDDALKRISSLYPVAYGWGAQGPDPLTYHHAPFSGHLMRVASRLHAEPARALFEALCVAAMQQHTIAALSYVLGFCTHYALDRTTYALLAEKSRILAAQRPWHTEDACRQMVLADIDAFMIGTYITPDVTTYKAYRLLRFESTECTVLSKTLSAAIHTVCGIRIKPASIIRSMQDAKRFFSITHNLPQDASLSRSTARKFGQNIPLACYTRPSVPLALDCANATHSPYPQDGTERAASFLELTTSAKRLAHVLQRAVIERYYKEKSLNAQLFDKNHFGEL